MPDLIVDSTITGDAKPSKDGPKYDPDQILLEETETEVEEPEEPEIIDTEIDEAEETETEETEETEDNKKPQIPFDRPSIQDIKAKYPEFFKDFPELRESYFREIEFTKIFPTVEDAKEAFTENEAFSTLSDSVLTGDPAPLLESIEKTDTKALEIFSLSFLSSLYKKDQNLYSQAITPIFQNLSRQMYADKDENIRNAALVLAEFLFGDKSVAEGKKSFAKSLELTEEQKKLKDTKESNLTMQFRQSVGRVQTSIFNAIESLALKNPSYDPNKVFSPFLRKQGAEEVRKRIAKALENDNGHLTIMAARWKRARANGYTSDDESKIVSTYLARAKSLIPDACSKVSAAMLGTKKGASQEKRERVAVASRGSEKENNSGRVSHSAENGKSSKIDYSKMSDMDILSS
jgi:hypothetical protein